MTRGRHPRICCVMRLVWKGRGPVVRLRVPRATGKPRTRRIRVFSGHGIGARLLMLKGNTIGRMMDFKLTLIPGSVLLLSESGSKGGPYHAQNQRIHRFDG